MNSLTTKPNATTANYNTNLPKVNTNQEISWYDWLTKDIQNLGKDVGIFREQIKNIAEQYKSGQLNISTLATDIINIADYVKVFAADAGLTCSDLKHLLSDMKSVIDNSRLPIKLKEVLQGALDVLIKGSDQLSQGLDKIGPLMDQLKNFIQENIGALDQVSDVLHNFAELCDGIAHSLNSIASVLVVIINNLPPEYADMAKRAEDVLKQIAAKSEKLHDLLEAIAKVLS